MTHSHLAKLSIFFQQIFEVFFRNMVPFTIAVKVNTVFEDVSAEVLESMWIIRNDGDELSVSGWMWESELALVHPQPAQQALVAHVEDNIAHVGACLFSLDDEV